jgi:hypothetical protein
MPRAAARWIFLHTAGAVSNVAVDKAVTSFMENLPFRIATGAGPRMALSLKEPWWPGGIYPMRSSVAFVLSLLARLAQRQDVLDNNAEREIGSTVPFVQFGLKCAFHGHCIPSR